MKKHLFRLFALLGVLLFLGAGKASAWFIYVENQANWSNPYCYTWVNGGNNEALGGWPGTKMTQVSGDIWVVQGTGNATHLKFHNNSGTETEQLNWIDGKCYWAKGAGNGNSGESFSMTPYLRGEFTNNWDATDAWKFNSEDGITYTLKNVTIPANKPFKISNFDWTHNKCSYYYKGTVEFNKTLNLTNTSSGNDNMTLSQEAKNATLEYNLSTHTLIIKVEEEKPDYTKWNVSLMNYNASSTFQSGNANASGIATFTNVTGIQDGIQVVVNNGSGKQYLNKYSSDLPLKTWVELTNAYESTVKPVDVNATAKYTIQFNVTNNQIYVDCTDAGSIDYSKINKIYVKGQGNDLNNDDPSTSDYSVTKKDHKYTFTINNLKQFKFSITQNPTDWDSFNAGAFAPVASSNNQIVTRSFGEGVRGENGQTLAIVNSGLDILVPWEGTYTVTIDEQFTYVNVVTTSYPANMERSGVRRAYLKVVDNNGAQVGELIPLSKKSEGLGGNQDNNQFTTLNVTSDLRFFIIDEVKDARTTYGASTSGQNVTVNQGGDPTEMTANASNYFTTPISTPTTIMINYWMEYSGSHRVQITSVNNEYANGNYPSEIYLYGHLNDKYWDAENFYVLKPVKNKPGVYSADFVDIRGTWSDGDIAQVSARKKFNTSGDENYVAFFTQKFDTSAALEASDKWGSYNNNGNIAVFRNEQLEPVVKHGAANSNNFMVAEGFYYVEFNLKNMTALFKKYDPNYKKRVKMLWYEGGYDESNNKEVPNDAEEIPNQDEHMFYGANNNYMQIAVDDNPEHRVARQVTYTVKYMSPAAMNSPKRRAFANATDGEEYTTIGDEGYYTNHIIKLNKVGVYEITASQHDEAVGVDKYELAEKENQIIVTVAEKSITASIGTVNAKGEQTIRAPFNPDGSIDLEKIFTITEDVEFDVIITPYDDADGWATETSALSPELLAEYQSFGSKVKIDGVYDPDKLSASAKIKDDEPNSKTYDVYLNVPCSGVYLLTFKPKDQTKVFVDQNRKALQSATVGIYPNITATFGTVKGFNIDGFSFGDDKQTIWYASETLADNQGKATAHVPGTYFQSDITISDNNNVKNQKRRVSSNVNHTEPVDLSALTGSTPSDSKGIYVSVTKNGATNDVQSFVVLSKSNSETGVDTIGAEEGEVEYFNLQGVKVENPEHGIYVKVQNGKAVKVVL